MILIFCSTRRLAQKCGATDLQNIVVGISEQTSVQARSRILLCRGRSPRSRRLPGREKGMCYRNRSRCRFRGTVVDIVNNVYRVETCISLYVV